MFCVRIFNIFMGVTFAFNTNMLNLLFIDYLLHARTSYTYFILSL